MIFIVKVVFSAALIGFLIYKADPVALFSGLHSLQPGPVVAAFILFLSTVPLCAERFRRLTAASHRIDFGASLEVTWIGAFFSQTLPSAIAGDPFRVLHLCKMGLARQAAILVTIADRVSGFSAMVILLWASAVWFITNIADPAANAVLYIVVAASTFVLMACLFLDRIPIPGRRLISLKEAAFTTHVIRGWLLQWRPGLAVFVLSVLVQVLQSATAWLIARALGLNLDFIPTLLFVPLMNLAAILPISVAGWGVRDALLVVTLNLVGISMANSLALSLTFGVIAFLCTLPGLFLWIFHRARY